ncbi:hypothetical protein K3495_g6497 [Podosphaera aphanis]|nr:hypothetical protein K3495_g6497 [Podosphaera aphanis]
MITEGGEYKFLSTPEMTIFLRVLKNDGHNTYYHISALMEDVKDVDRSTNPSERLDVMDRISLTSLRQILAFTIQITGQVPGVLNKFTITLARKIAVPNSATQ